MNSALILCDELRDRAYVVCDSAVRLAWENGHNEGWWGGITWGLLIAAVVVGWAWWWTRRTSK